MFIYIYIYTERERERDHICGAEARIKQAIAAAGASIC